MDQFRKELRAYYEPYQVKRADGADGWARFPEENRQLRQAIVDTMSAYAGAHPSEHPSLLKARTHEVMAELFTPVLFPHSPFFFEMGLRFAESWGTPAYPCTVGDWNLHAHAADVYQRPEWENILACQNMGIPPGAPHLWNIWSGFDLDHHCLGNTKLLRVGIDGLLREIVERLAQPCTADQQANLTAMARSCRAVLRVAAKFGESAASLLRTTTDANARRFLNMIVEATGHVPAQPPRTFYEGLAMLWFLREVTATMETIGVSVLGHVDRQLIELYRADLAAGRLTEAAARDLLARWMLPTDVKFHLEDCSWPETSTCLELGGCDEEGKVVWNEVTRLVIETHYAHRLINPKLNCRFSADSPREYLDLISRTILAGHNQFALLNDDVLIPACVRAGKTEREARLYVNGGCQETIVEGVEHSAGAYFYFNMPRILDLCLQPYAADASPRSLPADARALLPQPITEVTTFDDFSAQVLRALLSTMATGAAWARAVGTDYWRYHPCPFFSATLEGCIAHGKDYTQGGAKYNPSGIALCGLATMVDSLYAIRRAVFDDGWLSYVELQQALAANWSGYDELRARLRRLPKYGQGDGEVDALAAWLMREFADGIRAMPNERGGHYQGSFFVYYAFSWFAPAVRATPDGRVAGELLSQGIAPHRTTASANITETIHTLSSLDFCDFPGNNVLDVQLPIGQAIAPETLTAVMRSFAQLGGPTLQPNSVDIAQLRDAQLHPEQHKALTVRISGLSAYFVTLNRDVQDEIIARAVVSV